MGNKSSIGRANRREGLKDKGTEERLDDMQQVLDRVKGCLYGLLIADALAAPTHWFYGGPRQVEQVYGSLLTGYTKPSEHLAGSIMSKSNTGGGGRGGFSGDIIGQVIFHGKKKFWAPGADYHYHHALQAGDNTLEGLLMRRALVVTAEHAGRFDEDEIREDYIKFMTTPDTHNDTYCGTCHRMFFANYMSGKKPKDCPDNDGHNVDSIDALVTTVPISFIADSDEQAVKDVKAMVAITRNSRTSQKFAAVFTQMLRDVVLGKATVRDAATKAGSDVGFDVRAAVARHLRSDPLTACYLDSSFPACLVMAVKYSSVDGKDPGEMFRIGVLANANRGGENVGSGALLGALWGAEIGFSNIPKDLVDNLAPSQHDQVVKEIDAFVASLDWMQQCSM